MEFQDLPFLLPVIFSFFLVLIIKPSWSFALECLCRPLQEQSLLLFKQPSFLSLPLDSNFPDYCSKLSHPTGSSYNYASAKQKFCSEPLKLKVILCLFFFLSLNFEERIISSSLPVWLLFLFVCLFVFPFASHILDQWSSEYCPLVSSVLTFLKWYNILKFMTEALQLSLIIESFTISKIQQPFAVLK